MSEFKQQLWSINMIPNDILFEKNKKLEQALEEIKEIAKECEKTKNCSNCYFFVECDDNGYGLIIKKISEVLDD